MNANTRPTARRSGDVPAVGSYRIYCGLAVAILAATGGLAASDVPDGAVLLVTPVAFVLGVAAARWIIAIAWFMILLAAIVNAPLAVPVVVIAGLIVAGACISSSERAREGDTAEPEVTAAPVVLDEPEPARPTPTTDPYGSNPYGPTI